MRTIYFLIIGYLCFLFSLQVGQAQQLKTAVSLQVKEATLPQVLQQIQQQYGLRFSYLNNEMPANRRFSAQITNQPLSEVLDVLLEQTAFGYQESQGQIIIKQGFPKAKPKTSTFRPLPQAAPAPTPVPQPTAAPGKASAAGAREGVKTPIPMAQPKRSGPADNPAERETTAVAQAQNATLAPLPVPSPVMAYPPVLVTETHKGSAGAMPAPLTAEPISASETAGGEANTASRPAFLGKLKASSLYKIPMLNLNKEEAPSADQPDSVAFRQFHLGFVPPLSTNGVLAGRYVNNLSAHVLLGRSAGVEGAEFAGIGNITGSYVRGAQFAGLFNVVLAQQALQEVAMERTSGFQAVGGQFAGFLNVTAGDFRGAQFAGFLNVAGSGKGIQSAGFLNLAKNLDGTQLAGFMNVAQDVDGVQVAGFLNLAREVDVQVAGFLNVAQYLKGMQIGVLNIADSAAGVPIGLLSLVRKNGYRRVELYYADDFDANVTLKLGVRKFHNLLAVGVELQDARRWGYGYGFGSEWRLSEHLRVNTDLISYYVVERSYQDFPRGMANNNQLNLLNKFRLLGTLQFGRHLALFGGPTFNVMVSEYQETGSEQIGSSLGTNHFYDHTSAGGTNVKMWIGFNAGLRF